MLHDTKRSCRGSVCHDIEVSRTSKLTNLSDARDVSSTIDAPLCPHAATRRDDKKITRLRIRIVRDVNINEHSPFVMALIDFNRP